MQRIIRNHLRVVLLAFVTGQSGVCQYNLAGSFEPFNPRAITRDGAGAVFAGGATRDAHFPVTPRAYQTHYAQAVCNRDVHGNPIYCDIGFVAKFDPSGAIVWATYLGGTNGPDQVLQITLDSQGNVWVAGSPGSQDFPVTADAYRSLHSSMFLSELSPDGSQLLYSTFLDNRFSLLTLDRKDALYLIGGDAFPSTDTPRVIATKFDTVAKKLVYANTLLFPPVDAFYVAVAAVADNRGSLYFAGVVRQYDFPITPGVYSHPSTGYDAFLVGVDPTGALKFSTRIGGSGDDYLTSMTRDADGNFYLTGIQGTNKFNSFFYPPLAPSPDFPVTSDALQSSWGPGFLLKLSPDASKLLYSSFLGMSRLENAYGVFVPQQLAVGADGKLVMLANSGQNDFPLTPDAYQPCYLTDYGDTGLRWTYLRFTTDLRAIEYSTLAPQGYKNISGPFSFDTEGKIYLSNYYNTESYFTVFDVSKPQTPGPVCLANYITHTQTPAVPGLLVTLFGSGIGPPRAAALTLDGSGRVSKELAGAQVMFDGIPAPILFAGPSRIDAVVPFAVATSGNTTISVRQDGSFIGSMTNPLAPRALTQFAVEGANPAKAGDILTYYATGAGTMTPRPVDGTIPTAPMSTVDHSFLFQWSDGSREFYCPVLYAGDAPGQVEGIVQFNCQVTTVPPGGTADLVFNPGNTISRIYIK